MNKSDVELQEKLESIKTHRFKRLNATIRAENSPKPSEAIIMQDFMERNLVLIVAIVMIATFVIWSAIR